MANFIDTIGNIGSGIADAAGNLLGNIAGQNNQTTGDFNQNGFIVSGAPSADGTGLPSSKVTSGNLGKRKRQLIHFFLPEFGVVQMYINPSNIVYQNKKLIQKDRTRGGYVLQYYGEELTQINMTGVTGSSGIEGINVLYEVYRSEQLAFDGIGLTLAANNASVGAAQSIANGIGNSIGSIFGGDSGGNAGGSIAQSLLGVDQTNSLLAPRNIPSLASLAFSVEMFHQGWIYRGYFDSMSITESITNLGNFEYSMIFMATQRRGYRQNQFSWQKSANSGPSGDSAPYTFRGQSGQ